MRTIETKVYEFDELTDEAKETAVEQVRTSYYNYNNFAEWAIDDCALLEPKHDELNELFGSKYEFPLLKNTRKNIYFSTDRDWFLSCEEAIEVQNIEQFLTWLGLPTELINDDDFSYEIFTPRYRNADTTIQFDGYASEYDAVIGEAIDKFESHIDDVLRRIEQDIDYHFTDEAIIEDIEANDYEFTEDGSIY